MVVVAVVVMAAVVVAVVMVVVVAEGPVVTPTPTLRAATLTDNRWC